MDDLLPNDGAAFDLTSMPQERIDDENDLIKRAAVNYPILDELIGDFEQDIKDADSLTSLGITDAMPDRQVAIIRNGNARYIENLNIKLQALKDMKEAIESRKG